MSCFFCFTIKRIGNKNIRLRLKCYLCSQFIVKMKLNEGK
jgi:hypothetical protein